MPFEQLELQPRPAPKIWAVDVERLIAQLRGRGWVTAAELGAMTEGAKRRIRATCEASGTRIVSGQHGYKLTSEMTVTEYNECRARLRAMARGILGRVRSLDRAYHCGVRSEGESESESERSVS